MPKDTKSPSLSQHIIECSDEYYEVETILDRRLSPNGMLYLIKWKNYQDPIDYTWEPLNHLSEVKELIEQFNSNFVEKKVKLKNQKISKQEINPVQKVSIKQSYDKYSYHDEELQKETKEFVAGKKNRNREILNKKDSKDQTLFQRNSQFEGQVKQSAQEEIKIRSRKIQNEVKNKTIKVIQKKKSILKKQPPKQNKLQIYEKSKFGRIYNHFCQNGKIYFKVNLLNNSQMVNNIIVYSFLDLQETNKQNVRSYLQGYFKQVLKDQSEEQTEQYKNMQDYWKIIT